MKKKSGIVFFDLDEDGDFSNYLEYWRGGATRRPHDHPAYIKLMRQVGYKCSAIIYFEEDIPKILYSFYLIKINERIPLDDNAESYYHLVSSYGYGGPVLFDNISVIKKDNYISAWSNFVSSKKIISEFVREDLFEDNRIESIGQRVEQQRNVVVQLNLSKDLLLSGYKYSVRKNIKRARESGLITYIDSIGSRLADFVEIYHGTMKRTNANAWFCIPYEDFFEFNKYLIVDDLGFYIHIMHDGTIVSSELVLKSRNVLYSFLGGGDIAYSNMRPNDLLKNEVCCWGCDNGYSYYVLGGGVTPNDGIFQFKLAFAPEGSTPFYLRKMIYDQNMYDSFLNRRKELLRTTDTNWEPRNDYFPTFFS